MDIHADPFARVLLSQSHRDTRGRFSTPSITVRSDRLGGGGVSQPASYLHNRAGIFWFDEHVVADATPFDQVPAGMSEPDTCPICLDHCQTDTLTTQCSHVFHPECIRQLIIVTGDRKDPDQLTCPMCRRLLLADLAGPMRFALFQGIHWPRGIPDTWLRLMVGSLGREDWHFDDDQTGRTIRTTVPPAPPTGSSTDTIDLTANETLDEDDLAYLSEAEVHTETEDTDPMEEEDPDWAPPTDWIPPPQTPEIPERLRRVRRVLRWGPEPAATDNEPRTPPNQVVPSGVPGTPVNPTIIPMTIIAPDGPLPENIVISDNTPNNRVPAGTPGISPEMHMAPLFRHLVINAVNTPNDQNRAGPAGAILTTFEHVLGADNTNPHEQVPYARISINLPDLLTQISNGETFRAFSPACESSMGASIVANDRGITINFALPSLIYHYVRTQELHAHLLRQQNSER